MSKITKYLNQLTVGNVFDDKNILEAYSGDRSVLKIVPKMVALPESTEDVQKLLHFFNLLTKKNIKVPIAVRGSGLDELGADLSNGVIISTEKLNHLMEIDVRERLVRVQSGITLKELNTALSVNGLTLPVSVNENETIGGIISGLPNDDSLSKHGGIMKYVERLEVVIPNGDCIQTNRFSKYVIAKKASEKTPEGKLYQKLYQVCRENPALLEKMRAKNLGAAGYPNILKMFKKDTIDPMPLFFGAEGTLGVITEIILRVVPVQKFSARVASIFPSFDAAKKFLDVVSILKPDKLNLIDLRILKSTESVGKNLVKNVQKYDSGFLAYAYFSDKASLKKVTSLAKSLPKTVKFIAEDRENRPFFQELDNVLASYLNITRDGEKVPLLSDFYLPTQNLPAFLGDIKILEKKMQLELPLYGSYINSTFSIRPAFKLSEPNANKKMLIFLKAGAYVIDRRNGLLAGKSPEGRVKSIITNQKLDAPEKALYKTIKNIFDEYGIMNPSAKLGADARSVVRYIRTSSPMKIVI